MFSDAKLRDKKCVILHAEMTVPVSIEIHHRNSECRPRFRMHCKPCTPLSSGLILLQCYFPLLQILPFVLLLLPCSMILDLNT